MIGPNLSDWALKHRSFVIFAMIAVTIAGLASYFRLGRSEDPAFTFRTMIVQASWPGATLDDTPQQVTERLERKLQETRGPRLSAQLHESRHHDHLRQLERIDDGFRGSRHLVSGPEEHWRYSPHASGWRCWSRIQRRLW
jgi:AcrB/AcrD/AcrF family